jgi:hypothetical protein
VPVDAAREVAVIDDLDERALDPLSLRMLEITVDGRSFPFIFDGPISGGAGAPVAGAGLDVVLEGLDPSGRYCVQVECELDGETGLLGCLLSTVDPATGLPPSDPSLGFLGDQKEGSLTFVVAPRPEDEAGEGTEVKNRAKIIFDDQMPGLETAEVRNVLSSCAGSSVRFRRGDANADGARDIADVLFTLMHLFSGGVEPSCRKALDANDDGVLGVSDPLALLRQLFLGAARPAPAGACGFDPSADFLDCEGATGCPAI